MVDSRCVSHFDFHGLPLTVRTDHDRIRTAVESRFGQFVGTFRSGPGATFDIERCDDLGPRRSTMSGRPVYDTDLGEVLYCDEQDRLTIDCGSVFVDARLAEGLVVTGYEDSRDETLALAAHPLLTLPLMEICKRRGLFPLHAAAIARDGRAALIPAASGGGKTTLSIALGLAGNSFMSDDMVFLRGQGVGMDVFGFADELDITDTTAAMFAQLDHLVGKPTWGGRPKHQLRCEAIGMLPVPSASPALLVFPHLTHQPRSTTERMEPAEALLEIVPNVLLTDPLSSQAQLAMLGSLVETVPAVRLHLGTDLDDAVCVVEEILA